MAGRSALRSCLEKIPDLQLGEIARLNQIPRLDLENVQGMVFYFHHKQITRQALEQLDTFITRGGGLLAIHSASASFKTEPLYHRILGGHFREHGAVQEMRVLPAQSADAIFGDIAQFCVTDELYINDYDPHIQIHFYSPHEEVQEPVVWTHQHGAGRVCFCSLGHRADTMRHPSVQQIITRGLNWVCRNELNLAGFDER